MCVCSAQEQSHCKKLAPLSLLKIWGEMMQKIWVKLWRWRKGCTAGHQHPAWIAGGWQVFQLSHYFCYASIQSFSRNLWGSVSKIVAEVFLAGRLFCVIHIVSYSPIFKENCTHILCHTYCVIHFFTVSFSVIHQLNSQIFCHTSWWYWRAYYK